MKKIEFKGAETDKELKQILDLQKQNYRNHISPEEAKEQGFVSIEHDFNLLKEMNTDYPHIIAKTGDKVVGYALVMLQKFGDQIPILFPMFDRINQLDYEGVSMQNKRYFIMGQVCIAKSHRGMGIFKLLYQHLAEQMKDDFDFIITEVASRNTRSMRAHKKVGFQVLKNYTAEEEWNIILFDLKG